MSNAVEKILKWKNIKLGGLYLNFLEEFFLFRPKGCRLLRPQISFSNCKFEKRVSVHFMILIFYARRILHGKDLLKNFFNLSGSENLKKQGSEKRIFLLDLISQNYLLPRALATVMARYPPTVLPSVVKLYSQKTIEK